MISIARPLIGFEEEASIQRVLASGQFHQQPFYRDQLDNLKFFAAPEISNTRSVTEDVRLPVTELAAKQVSSLWEGSTDAVCVDSGDTPAICKACAGQ